MKISTQRGYSVRRLSAVAVAVGLAGSPALATDWIEPRANDQDAGAFFDSAQMPIGFGELESITGRLDGDSFGFGPGSGTIDGQDLFLISIPIPSLFTATTVPFGFEDIDTQLFLFSADGFGLLSNDNQNSSVLFSRLVPMASDGTFMLTTPGNYVIGVAGAGNFPTSGGAAMLPIFNSSTFDEVSGPDGPGGALVHDGWSGPFTEGRYVIQLTGAAYVPAPGAGVLLGIGLAAGLRRRRGAAALR